MTNAEAIEELNRLLSEEPGRLQIITNVPTGAHGDNKKPSFFVSHAVTSIEVDGETVKANSDEGDWTMGEAAKVLSRLLEASAEE